MPGVLEPSADGYMEMDSVDAELDVNANPKATVFASPGSKPDVRFRVFDDEYHLHSAVLIYHSKFFRQLLDSPGKPAGPDLKSFYYEYDSVFDKDGSTLQRPNALAGFDFVTESNAFRKFRRALFTRPYVIDNPQELIAMTRFLGTNGQRVKELVKLIN
ncbi:hypothetical protein BKA65DRAFT_475597 [Rhexocercosporidium sp. MPI-PUGE-AT-0058]|nr:hypothetical protein BKA65DRAFT_475597 [Rhexocercosporidium sp. MPI-PUGE-AT-0058]